MTDTLEPDQLLKSITELKAGPPLRRFRALCTLSRELQVAIEAIKLAIREQENLLRETDDDVAFIKQHRGKMDICYRALRATYTTPDRAMAAFNALCTSMNSEALMDAVRAGSNSLGKPIGASFLGMASQARKKADDNFVSMVIPAIAKIIPDHKSYLEMVAGNLEFEHEKLRETLGTLEAERLTLDGTMSQFEREILAAALAMTPDDLKTLQPQSDEYRMAMALIGQRDPDEQPLH
jgi:hypothetical protein